MKCRNGALDGMKMLMKPIRKRKKEEEGANGCNWGKEAVKNFSLIFGSALSATNGQPASQEMRLFLKAYQ